MVNGCCKRLHCQCDFCSHSLVGAILLLLAGFVAFCSLSSVLQTQVKWMGGFKVPAFLAIWKVINCRKLLNYFMGRKSEMSSLGTNRNNGERPHHSFCCCAQKALIQGWCSYHLQLLLTCLPHKALSSFCPRDCLK